MSEILFRYERVDPTSWAYLSALLVVALFFKFNRLLSVRNLDLVLLVLLSPGLLCVKWGRENAVVGGANAVEHLGYLWLFVVHGLILVRTLWDSAMVRRPLLEPNMNASGMTFLALSLYLFLMANVITGEPDLSDLQSAQRAQHLSQGEASEVERSAIEMRGPGFALLYALPEIVTARLLGDRADRPMLRSDQDDPPPAAEETEETEGTEGDPDQEADPLPSDFTTAAEVTAKVAVILSQLMIVLGMVLIGVWHFENTTLGVAAAILYLLLPYTAMWTGSGTHALPGALLVWTIVNYRRPMIAGVLLGLAFGTAYYPVFLLPLWFSFYWRRGKWRLLIGIVIAVVALVITQIFTSSDVAMFLARMQQMFGIRLPQADFQGGVWQYWYGYYRYPVLAAFLGLSLATMPLWPAEKNLGTLLSCSAAIMLAVQFWDVQSDGLALAWYLPLLLLMIFRPNLEDRIPINVVR